MIVQELERILGFKLPTRLIIGTLFSFGFSMQEAASLPLKVLLN